MNHTNRKSLDKAAGALLKMGPVKHKRPPKPTKKEMERKFKMRFSRGGKPSIREVE